MSTQALGMLQGLAGANQTGDKPPQLFGEEQARKAADTMGVTFVSGEPYKTGELEGYRARYSFADIAQGDAQDGSGHEQPRASDPAPRSRRSASRSSAAAPRPC